MTEIVAVLGNLEKQSLRRLLAGRFSPTPPSNAGPVGNRGTNEFDAGRLPNQILYATLRVVIDGDENMTASHPRPPKASFRQSSASNEGVDVNGLRNWSALESDSSVSSSMFPEP